jgi:hypothetical protein
MLDDGLGLDEEELRRGAGRDSCICPAERKTARRHGPPCRSPRYEQLGCPRSLSACKHPNSDAVRKRSEPLPGSAPATHTLAVGDLAAALRLPMRNRHEPGNRASALPRQQPSRRARRTTGSPRLSGSHAARGRRHSRAIAFPMASAGPHRPRGQKRSSRLGHARDRNRGMRSFRASKPDDSFRSGTSRPRSCALATDRNARVRRLLASNEQAPKACARCVRSPKVGTSPSTTPGTCSVDPARPCLR